MRVLGRVATHIRLIARMARATRTDLIAAMESGDLSPRGWADMVQTCRRCDWAGRCAEWLIVNDRAERAPDTCLNRTRFAALKAAAGQIEES